MCSIFIFSGKLCILFLELSFITLCALNILRNCKLVKTHQILPTTRKFVLISLQISHHMSLKNKRYTAIKNLEVKLPVPILVILGNYICIKINYP